MTPQPYELAREHPLTTDEQVLTRVLDLIQHAIRRQIWLMFLDEDQRQLPLLMPSYVPRHPESGAVGPFGEFLGSLFEEVDASSMVIIFERIGSDTLGEGDREWFRLIHAACVAEGIPLRGPILAHDGGVRWIATEDYLV